MHIRQLKNGLPIEIMGLYLDPLIKVSYFACHIRKVNLIMVYQKSIGRACGQT